MRMLKTHQSVNDCNAKIEVFVKDEKNAAGANCWYEIGWGDVLQNPTCNNQVYLRFQEGDPNAVGVNGVTNEALLAVLMDRLEGFQSGPFKCEENEEALDHLKHAMAMLAFRSEKRILRNVDGQQVP